MKSKGKLFLFHWDEKAASARAAELAGDGWLVEMEFEEGSRGCKNLKAFGPDVVVFDIAKKAVHSRECGRALRNAKSYRETPFVFVDGTDEDISKVREKVPAAIFTTSEGLTKILANFSRQEMEDGR
jgi:DNA-binding NarL/FixJ family response regulator